MGGQQAKQLFSPPGKQRVGANWEFVIDIIDIAEPRLNKTTKAFNGARKDQPGRLGTEEKPYCPSNQGQKMHLTYHPAIVHPLCPAPNLWVKTSF